MDLSAIRIGIGHDTHRLVEGGPLRVGGISVPHDRQLEGHSDADVLLHAVIDAILGAAGLGDIGQMFPNTAEENRNRDSADMLTAAWHRAEQLGYRIANLDAIIFAERPKLAAFYEPMEQRIAELLKIGPNRVNVKAKTGEGVDAVGQGQAMMAQCVALLVRIEPQA